MRRLGFALVVALAACQPPPQGATTPRPRVLPSVQIGACATPDRDGVVGQTPRIERADRDLNGDGAPETIAVDRSLCTPDGNCSWNVFVSTAGECLRFAGALEASRLEVLSTKGDDNMADIRGYWTLQGGRLLLQSYRYARGGYRIVDVLVCKYATDDKLDCADTEH